jgi:hypothetical protein
MRVPRKRSLSRTKVHPGSTCRSAEREAQMNGSFRAGSERAVDNCWVADVVSRANQGGDQCLANCSHARFLS